MSFEQGVDDRLIVDIDDPEDEEELEVAGADYDTMEEAMSHAWCDKVRGVPRGANLDPEQTDSQGVKMQCLLQLVTYDDWFLWYMFVNSDFSEARMQIVRG